MEPLYNLVDGGMALGQRLTGGDPAKFNALWDAFHDAISGEISPSPSIVVRTASEP